MKKEFLTLVTLASLVMPAYTTQDAEEILLDQEVESRVATYTVDADGTRIASVIYPRLSKQAKRRAFESETAAFFNWEGKSKALWTYDPVHSNVCNTEYRDGKTGSLVQTKETKALYVPQFIFETYFANDKKKGLDVLRPSSNPSGDALVAAYTKGMPMLWTLDDEAQLSSVVTHLRAAFEKSGITATQNKPLLVVYLGNTSYSEFMLESNASFLTEYFTLSNFTDDEVSEYFLEKKQPKMFELFGDTLGQKKYKTDNVATSVLRDFNGRFDKFEPKFISNTIIKNAVKFAGYVSGVALLAIITHSITDPLKNDGQFLGKNGWIDRNISARIRTVLGLPDPDKRS